MRKWQVCFIANQEGKIAVLPDHEMHVIGDIDWLVGVLMDEARISGEL
jgi:hypothetical protein